MLQCHDCKKERFLIRCLCIDCAPELHNSHNFWLKYIQELEAEFEEGTGKDSNKHYGEFEAFSLKKIAEAQLQMRMPI